MRSDRTAEYSGRNIDRALTFEKSYKTPIDERSVEDCSDGNIASTPRKEDLSIVSKDVHQERNRDEIHGLPDNKQLGHVGLLKKKFTGQENVRDSNKFGVRKLNTNETALCKEKLTDRLEGE